MTKRLVFVLLALMLMLSACSSAAATPDSYNRDTNKAMENAEGAPALAQSADAENPNGQTNSTSGAERLVIRNATLSLVVVDPAKAMDSITKMAEQMNGFVVSSNLYKTSTSEGLEVPIADITVRVPAEKLNDALTQIKSLVEDANIDILNENISGQDVTKEYTDLKSRLTNLENAEKQLQKIMDNAVKTEDVLNVYNQLIQIREQIEVIKGQIKYYEESAAMSAISVNLRSKASVKPLTIGGWQPVGVARDALQALVNTLKFLANALIWIVIFMLPIGLILFAFFRLIWLVFKRIRKTPARKTPPTPPTVQ